MDRELVFQHRDLQERWGELSLCEQMGNIGSEVSRAMKWQAKNRPEISEKAFFRALELIDFSIGHAVDKPGRLRELLLARDELCDYFTGNSFGSDPERIMRYYNQFALSR